LKKIGLKNFELGNSMNNKCSDFADRISDQFNALRRYVTGLTWFFSILETLCGLAFGAMLGARFSGVDSYTWLLWLLGVFYVILLALKIWAQKLCPPALVEELNAKVSLNQAKAEVARKETIDAYVAHAICALNKRTCAINSQVEDQLCNTAIVSGLVEVLDPLINTPQYILDCNKSKFTISTVISHLHALESPNAITADYIHSILNFRDDLEITGYLNANVLDESNLTGVSLQIQNLIRTARNDNKLCSGNITASGRKAFIICSPIPLVCEIGAAGGVILMAHEGTCELPNDIENVLLIFGRIVSNWLSKYDDCVRDRVIKKNMQIQEREKQRQQTSVPRGANL